MAIHEEYRDLSIAELVRPQSRYIDLRFDDGTHSGVRLLRGTSIIEVQRKGVKKLFDLAEYEPVEVAEQPCYNGG